MKRLVAAFCGLFVLISWAHANTPPWFHSALIQFLDKPRVLVLGWSKDGKAAVLSPVDGEGRGGTGMDLWVIDTVEDQVLKVVDIWSDEFEEIGDSSQALAKAIESSKKAQFFLDALKAAAIQPADPQPFEVSAFPLKTPKTQYMAETLTVPLGPEVEGVPGRAIDWRLVVRSGQGEKTIAKGREDNAIDAVVRGYVTSPWEPRILVVYGITHLGFEGEQPLTYLFSGCLLTTGFAPK